MKKEVRFEFNPPIYHPFYFIRRGLLQGIEKYSMRLNGRMMDFGCGSKPYKNLFKNVSEYIGIDFENTGHPHENEQIDVFYDGKNIPFSDNHFDSVLASEVFEHIFNLDQVLAEINRVLKPEGNILITVPFVWNEHEVPFDYARYTVFALKDMLEKKGFDIVEMHKCTDYIKTIAQMRALYITTAINPILKKVFRYIPFVRKGIFFFLILFSNLWGSIASAILPKRYDWYCNTVVLAKKKST